MSKETMLILMMLKLENSDFCISDFVNLNVKSENLKEPGNLKIFHRKLYNKSNT
jgi:hypothetical protein